MQSSIEVIPFFYVDHCLGYLRYYLIGALESKYTHVKQRGMESCCWIVAIFQKVQIYLLENKSASAFRTLFDCGHDGFPLHVKYGNEKHNLGR